jgi:hypothetical protein
LSPVQDRKDTGRARCRDDDVARVEITMSELDGAIIWQVGSVWTLVLLFRPPNVEGARRTNRGKL